jgi:hypothetical protein
MSDERYNETENQRVVGPNVIPLAVRVIGVFLNDINKFSSSSSSLSALVSRNPFLSVSACQLHVLRDLFRDPEVVLTRSRIGRPRLWETVRVSTSGSPRITPAMQCRWSERPSSPEKSGHIDIQGSSSFGLVPGDAKGLDSLRGWLYEDSLRESC